MGAVEDIVDVMRCVADVFKCARTIKPKLIASFASVSIVRYNTQLEVYRTGRGGKKP